MGQHMARHRTAQSQGAGSRQGDPLTSENLKKELEDTVPQSGQCEFLSPWNHKGGDVFWL